MHVLIRYIQCTGPVQMYGRRVKAGAHFSYLKEAAAVAVAEAEAVAALEHHVNKYTLRPRFLAHPASSQSSSNGRHCRGKVIKRGIIETERRPITHVALRGITPQ